MDLVLHDLRKQFSVGGERFTALDGVTLHVPDGQYVTVMGSNGAGKSTMLNAVAGAVLPDSGTIRLGERDVTRLPENRRARNVSRVFQDSRIGTAPTLTLAENIALAALRSGRRSLRRGVPKALRAQIVERMSDCGLSDLESRLDQQVGTLSGGQRQAISLMMASWEHPGLLLLDEHTAALDPSRAASIMDLTSRVQSEGHLTVLMVTHDVNQAITFGDRLIMMDRGRIVEDIAGDEKRSLTFEAVIDLFQRKGMQVNDRTLLTEGGPAA